MRISMIFALVFLTASACAQTGGDIRWDEKGSGAPLAPEIAPGQIGFPARPDKAINKPTNEALDRNLEKLSLHNTPFSQAIDQLAKDAHLDVAVHWKEIEDAGVPRNLPVTLELVQVPVRRALGVLLALAGGPSARLHFIVDNNQVVISTREELESAKYQAVLVYDCRALFADWEYDSPEAALVAKNLADTVRAVVAPDSWRDSDTGTSGSVGVINMLNGQLIVNQTLENHDAIVRLLQELSDDHGRVGRSTRAYDVGDLVKNNPEAQVPALIGAIQANCGRDTWRGHGGKTSTIAYFNGKLYVTTRAAIHDQIDALLKLMRQQ